MTSSLAPATPHGVGAIADPDQLHRDGCVLLRGAIPRAWLDHLCAQFDAGVRPSEQWPVPRGTGWRYAMVDLDATVQAVCRLPVVLAAVGELIGERFFLSQVEGREPLAGCGHQGLHRDLSAQRPGDTVNAMVFFDDYGPENGATRFVPGSHRPEAEAQARASESADESLAVYASGAAGDILVFDADLLHAASVNRSGARRRSLLVTYLAEPLYAVHLESASLRNVRMETAERFDPPARLRAG